MRLPSFIFHRKGKRFNPRIRKGCDDTFFIGRRLQPSFNPRIRKGCDDEEPGGCHAQFQCFNPRIRKGCDSMFMKSFIDNTFNL